MHALTCFIAAILALTPLCASAQLTIAQADVDSLHLPYALPELLTHLDSKMSIDKPVFLSRKWKTTRAYYRFQLAKQELSLLSQITRNLRAIHQLHRKQREQADIADADYLQSSNEVIAKEIALLHTEVVCRANLLTIIELCLIEIKTHE